MADWSVVGEILGETNLDEVGESVQRSLQDAAEATQKAAAGSEDMEKSMDSATEAVASLAAASDEADDQLEEVEAEMEDIVTDAGAAAGSVTVLGSTLDGLDDVDIHIDTNIDEINAAWAEMRNDIDDFEHRVDDIIPRGGDGGAPIVDFPGDQRKFEDTIDTLDRAQDTMNEIADARDRAMGDDDGRDLRPFRRLPEGLPKSARSNIIDRLDFSDTDGGLRQGPAQVGGILSRGDERTAGKLAGAIASLDEVASSQQEVLRALNREVIDLPGETIETRSGLPTTIGDALGDPVEEGFQEAFREAELGDTVPALPAPDAMEGVRGDDTMGGRVDVPSRAFQTPAVGRGDMRGAQMPVDEVIEVDPGAFGEGFVGMSQEDLDIRERGRAIDLGATDFDNLISGLNEPITMAQDDLRDFHERTSDATDSTSRLSRAMDSLQDSVSRRVRRGVRGARERVGGARERVMGGMTGEIMDIRTARSRAAVSGLDADLDDLSRAAAKTNTSLGFLMASMNLLTGQAATTEAAIDSLDDDVDDLAASLAVLSSGFENLSANLGPFNISLSNLLITVPILIAALGPLVAILAGLASALIAVVGAFGALLAVGALGFIEDLKNNFAEIESTSDAVMTIMRGLKNAIIDALEPLQDVKIGGLGAQGIFVTFLRDIVTLINMFSEAMAALLGMDEVENFLLRLRAAVLGFSEETEGGLSMIEGLEELMKGALPILGDFLVWFIDVLPEFLAFTGAITQEAAPALAELSQSFLRLSILLTEVGAGAFTILLPALALVFDVATAVLAILVKIESELGLVADTFFALAGAGLFAVLALAKMVSVFESALIFSIRMSKAVALLNSALVGMNSTMLTTSRRMMLMVGRFLLVAAGIYLILDALGWLEPVMEGINDIMAPLTAGFTGLTDGMGMSEEATNDLIDALKLLTGAFIVASWAASQLFAVSMAGAAKAMLTFAGGALTTTIGLLSALATELIISTGGLWGLISAETTATIVTEGFTGAVWSAVASLSALQIVTGVAVVAAIALLASEMLGFTDVLSVVEQAVLAFITAVTVAFLGSGWGAIIVAVGLLIAALINLKKVVGPVAASVIAAIGAITAAFLGSGWGAIIVALGLAAAAIYMLGKRFGWLKVIAIAAIGAITAALIGSGWGAIIVALGLLLLLLIEYWDELAGAVEGAISWFDNLGPAGKAAILMILAPMSPLLAGLLAVREAIGLILNPQKRQEWWNAIQAGLDGLLNTIKSIIDWVILLFTDPMAAIGQLFQWIKGGIQELLSLVGGQSSGEGGGGGIQGTGSSVAAGAAAGAAAGSAIPGAETVGSAIGGTAGLVDEHVYDLPVLQKGGFIKSSGLAFLHSNEMVVPEHMFANADVNTGAQTGGGRTSGGGGGGTTVNVNVQGGDGNIDDRRARQIGRIARRSIAEQRRFEDGR